MSLSGFGAAPPVAYSPAPAVSPLTGMPVGAAPAYTPPTNSPANIAVRQLLAARGLPLAGGTGASGVNSGPGLSMTLPASSAISMDRTSAVNTPAGAPKPITATAVPPTTGIPPAAGVAPTASTTPTVPVPTGDTTPQYYTGGAGGIAGMFSPEQMNAINQNVQSHAGQTLTAQGFQSPAAIPQATRQQIMQDLHPTVPNVSGQAPSAGSGSSAASNGAQAQVTPPGNTPSALRGILPNSSGWTPPAQDTSATGTLGATGTQMLNANQISQSDLDRAKAFDQTIDAIKQQMQNYDPGSAQTYGDLLKGAAEQNHLRNMLHSLAEVDPNRYKEAMAEQGQRLGTQMLGGAAQAQTQSNIENVRASEAAYGAEQGVYGQASHSMLAAMQRSATAQRPVVTSIRGVAGDTGAMVTYPGMAPVKYDYAQMDAAAKQQANLAAQSAFVARLKASASPIQGADGNMYRWDSARNGVVRVEQ